MIKYIVTSIIFSIILFCNIATAQPENKKPVQELKMEQKAEKDYKYGSFDKTFKNDKMEQDDNLSKILDKQQTKKEPTVLDVFNALVFVIFLILLTGWIYMKLKKINPEQLLSGNFKKLDRNNFKIISSLQLGAGKSIHLIEINNKQLIVGTTSNSVNLLAEMEKNESNNEIPQECIEKLFNDKSDELKKLEE